MNLEYFRLIDRIIEIDVVERRIVVEAIVPEESTVFDGHFPGHPLMPGVLLIEAMAQTSGWLVLAVDKFTRMPLLAQVREAKLRSFVTPGTTLNVAAELVHEGSGFAITKARVLRDGKAICNSDLTLRSIEFPNGEMRERMRETAQRIAFPMGLMDG